MTDQDKKTGNFISTGLEGIIGNPTCLPSEIDKAIQQKVVKQMDLKSPKPKPNTSPLDGVSLPPAQVLPFRRSLQHKKQAQAFFKENYLIGFKSAKSGAMNIFQGSSFNSICERLFHLLDTVDRTFQNRLYQPSEIDQISDFLSALILEHKVRVYKGLSTTVGSGRYLLLPKNEALAINTETKAKAKVVGKQNKLDTLLDTTYVKERAQNPFHNFVLGSKELHLPRFMLSTKNERDWSKSNTLRFYKDQYHIIFTKTQDDKKVYKLNDLIYQDVLNSLFDTLLERGFVLKECKFKKEQLPEISTAINNWMNTGELRGSFSILPKSEATNLHNRTIQFRKRERQLAKSQKKESLTII